ncbi:MAG: lipopolysaccharide A protein [Oceanospirillaceae bacterium]|nr:lipopolysaccharide A protein [Oceanospirillaceae bacterium]
MLKNLIKIDLAKNQKLFFYIKSVSYFLAPKSYYQFRKTQLLNYFASINDLEYVNSRVSYYNKLDEKYALSVEFETINQFLKSKKKTYFFDLFQVVSLYDIQSKIAYLFGDKTHIPSIPTFIKSRPIAGNNKNSVLLKLNKVRHFIFVNDVIDYQDKKNMLVWRGKVHQEHRRVLMTNFFDHELFDIGETNTKRKTEHWQKKRMSLKEQLAFKFILSIEGNDVASNLKWAMSSNSLVLMTKPKYETWFMEGTLIENHHYVLLKDDYSDVDEKIQYYIDNVSEAQGILDNAHAYVEQFKNGPREELIAYLVVDKYLKLQQL